jgi:hypothetical protein
MYAQTQRHIDARTDRRMHIKHRYKKGHINTLRHTDGEMNTISHNGRDIDVQKHAGSGRHTDE